jgi:hypothetical protein
VGFGYLHQLKAALAGGLQTGISGMVEVKYYTTRGKMGGLPSLQYVRKLLNSLDYYSEKSGIPPVGSSYLNWHPAVLHIFKFWRLKLAHIYIFRYIFYRYWFGVPPKRWLPSLLPESHI